MINNKKLYAITFVILFSIILGIVVMINFNESEIVLPNDLPSNDVISYDNPTLAYYLEKYHTSHTISVSHPMTHYDIWFTPNDYSRYLQQESPLDGAKVHFNDSNLELIESLKPNDGVVVIYPIFTSAAYNEPGFYTYFAGNCDESCITDLSFTSPKFLFNSSGLVTQLLYSLGYEFVTDVDVDQNPEILDNYETVILLHNEYVTKNIFDAVTNHPNIIFLFPNALYAEIDVNYDDNTITLIRGHNYPEFEIANGFDYEIEERFHHYEYDSECLTWEFIEIENGHHLNCYPDGVIHNNLDILLKMKEL